MNKLEYSKEDIIELQNDIDKLYQENKQLKEQLNYLRSGEYYNQLRFERDMLQDLVDKMEISKEDKEFIDCTHRNTELLEENKRYKEVIDKVKAYIEELNKIIPRYWFTKILDILKVKKMEEKVMEKTFYELEKENKQLNQRIKEHIKRENKLIIKLIEKEYETNEKENY